MSHIYPDLEWYVARSTERGLPARCPYANVHACPRYYQSLFHLGDAGIATKIEPKIDKALLGKWKATPLWPVVDEHKTSIVNNKMFSNFCPEVSFDVFHLFASYLGRYADEIDKGNVEKWLVENGRSYAKDWRWDWSGVTEMHYSECPLYSQLPLKNDTQKQKSDEVLTIKPGLWGVSIDVKKLISRLARWWLARNEKSS